MKNVWIELWRWIFAIYMVVYHTLGHVYGVKTGGYIGVDVFFIISGYLLAASHEKCTRQGGLSAGGYLRGRFARLWPMYLCAYLFTAVLRGITDAAPWQKVLERIYRSFPEMFMLRIGTSINGVTWFIAAMLIAGALLWALLTWDEKQTIRREILPVCVVLIYGRFAEVAGRIHLTTSRSVFAVGHDGLWRAFAALSLGVIVATAVNGGRHSLSAAGRTVLTVLGNLGLAVVLFTSIKTYHSFADLWYIFLAACSVGCLFSSDTSRYTTKCVPPPRFITLHRSICWLGGLAYPIYLLHESIWKLFKARQIADSPLAGCLGVIAVTLAGAALLDRLLPKALSVWRKRAAHLFFGPNTKEESS